MKVGRSTASCLTRKRIVVRHGKPFKMPSISIGTSDTATCFVVLTEILNILTSEAPKELRRTLIFSSKCETAI
ncbi:unnamed protein product [Gongylonema pulchrum]|uniref:Uncharacterized protein n=1 Tax=Gongylonema pulchrum TaxID=637853 RepID=A0A183F1A4_9BILA|nr:unnamed protein product [Gongylonema pulchrum]